jgi:uncharacterized membrane protein
LVKKQEETVLCQICGQQKPFSISMLGEVIRPSITRTILKTHPEWAPSGYICLADLNNFRGQYVKEILEDEKGELSTMDQEVVRSLTEHDLLAKDLSQEYDKQLTFGERVADRVAEFGGSWGFIGFFVTIIIIWLTVNASAFFIRPFDPYPFILLNLVLSCIAALQAPIIIMSQNRQAERDRMRSKEDYKVNLKAELEIRQISDKIDHMLTKQWERMIDIQQIQMELMEEIAQKSTKGKTE